MIDQMSKLCYLLPSFKYFTELPNLIRWVEDALIRDTNFMGIGTF